MSLDQAVWDAKRRVTEEIVRLTRDIERGQAEVISIARVVDELNSAWDALSSRLVDQRKERDEEIARLLNLLAERRPK